MRETARSAETPKPEALPVWHGLKYIDVKWLVAEPRAERVTVAWINGVYYELPIDVCVRRGA